MCQQSVICLLFLHFSLNNTLLKIASSYWIQALVITIEAYISLPMLNCLEVWTSLRTFFLSPDLTFSSILYGSIWLFSIIFLEGSCKRSQLPLLGEFLSRHCFMMCTAMEVEHRELQSNRNATTVVFTRTTGERWWRMGKKCFYIILRLTRRLQVHVGI